MAFSSSMTSPMLAAVQGQLWVQCRSLSLTLFGFYSKMDLKSIFSGWALLRFDYHLCEARNFVPAPGRACNYNIREHSNERQNIVNCFLTHLLRNKLCLHCHTQKIISSWKTILGWKIMASFASVRHHGWCTQLPGPKIKHWRLRGWAGVWVCGQVNNATLWPYLASYEFKIRVRVKCWG